MAAEVQHVAEAAAAAHEAGVLGTLGIDAELFLAQLVNFGVVAFVMWKWVYTPLLKVMDERAKKIEQGLSDAAASGTARKQAEDAAATIVAEARGKAKQIMDDAVAAAEAQRLSSVDRAKAEVAKVVEQGRADLAADKLKLVNEVKQEVGALVAAATERVLGEKIDTDKDTTLIARALKDLAKTGSK